MTTVIAVFDIGRITKKIFLFDRYYNIVYEEEHLIEYTKDEDGFGTIDIELISSWIKQTLRKVLKDPKFDVIGVNFTTFGAAIVHLDKTGKPIAPLYNAFKPLPEELMEDFYQKYGGEEEFSLATSSPKHGMLNSGMQLYWMKYRNSDVFKQVKTSLHFPQYCSYLFTGKVFSEITSLGCHTGLWDFKEDRVHDWVYSEKLFRLFPPLVGTNSVVDVRIKGKTIKAGVGIRNSASALVPYRMRMDTKFMVLSTGIWNIAFNPWFKGTLTIEEVKRDCFYYMDYEHKPVRSSRLYLGYEHERQMKRIATHFKKNEDYFEKVKFDPLVVENLIKINNERKKFFPQHMAGTGPFIHQDKQEADLRLFKNFEEAYHQLILDLVMMQEISIRLAKDGTDVNRIFMTGGFCKNEIFKSLLASKLTDFQLSIDNIYRAAGLGAALVMHTHWNPEKLIDEHVDFQTIEPVHIPGLKTYRLFE